jgi:hypothetical protein
MFRPQEFITHSSRGIQLSLALWTISALFQELHTLKRTNDKAKFGTFQSFTYGSFSGITEREEDVRIVMNLYMRALDG